MSGNVGGETSGSFYPALDIIGKFGRDDDLDGIIGVVGGAINLLEYK